MTDEERKYREKIIIIGGSFQDDDFNSSEGMTAYPTEDEDCTYFNKPLPVCYDIGDIDKVDDE